MSTPALEAEIVRLHFAIAKVAGQGACLMGAFNHAAGCLGFAQGITCNRLELSHPTIGFLRVGAQIRAILVAICA